MKFANTLSAFFPIIGTLAAPGEIHQHPARSLEPREPSTSQVQSSRYWQQQADDHNKALCYVSPRADGGDDGPAIEKALTTDCKENALVVFPGPEYNINTPLKTMGLQNVQIEQFGRFLWSDDVDYWLTVSMPVGFQNQSTVWYFGGDNVYWDGHFMGTFDGNGQVWYDWAESQGNLPHRPMNINWRDFTNSKVHRLNFVQSQMWTMATWNARHVDFEDIYVNSTSSSKWSTLNTDGADTINSDDITFRRWKVSNGDDSIALKGNSTNIHVYDSEFWHGQGLAMGSIAQYDQQHDYIDGFYANNITLHDTTYVIYLKTWGGVSRGYPPNGGGGGLGYMRNINVENVVLDKGRRYPMYSWQCENYSGFAGKDCNSSMFHMDDISYRHIRGTTVSSVEYAGWFQCSAAAGGCHNITVEDFSVTNEDTGKVLDQWYCENVHDTQGFTCA